MKKGRGELEIKVDVVRDLPLVLSTRFMEDVLLAVDGKDTVFHDALPINPAMSVLFLPGKKRGEGIPLVFDPLHLIIHAKHDVSHTFFLLVLFIESIIRIIQIRINRILV
jgi:hypothetical protein